MSNPAKDTRYGLARSWGLQGVSAARYRLPFVFATTIGPGLDGHNTPDRDDKGQITRRETDNLIELKSQWGKELA